MPTTVNEIRGWLDEAKAEGATHVIVRRDWFDGSYYPVTVKPREDVRKKAEPTGDPSDAVVEVYSLTGAHSIEDQLRERFAIHYD